MLVDEFLSILDRKINTFMGYRSMLVL